MRGLRWRSFGRRGVEEFAWKFWREMGAGRVWAPFEIRLRELLIYVRYPAGSHL